MKVANEQIEITLPSESHPCDTWYDTKELIGGIHGIGRDSSGNISKGVTIKWYMGRSSSAMTVYCNFQSWNTGGEYAYYHGHGSAGGGGYCKRSASACQAIRKAGIDTNIYLNGAGVSEVDRFVIALMIELGYTDPQIFSF